MNNEFIVIEHWEDDNTPADPEWFPINDEGQVATAQQALRDAGLEAADVYVGDWEGDHHKNGQVLWSTER